MLYVFQKPFPQGLGYFTVHGERSGTVKNTVVDHTSHARSLDG